MDINIFDVIFYISLFLMLIQTSIIDFKTMYISTNVLLIYSAICFVAKILESIVYRNIALTNIIFESIFGAVVGYIVYFIIYYIAKLYYKKEAFGYGDVLLLSAIGLCLGRGKVIVIAILAFYVAMVLYLFSKLIGKKIGLRDEVPFGPSICIATVISFFVYDMVLRFYMI